MWIITALSIVVVTGLAAVFAAAVVNGRNGVAQADTSVAAADIVSEALATTFAVNHERAQALRVLVDPSSEQVNLYDETLAETDRALQSLRQTWLEHRDLFSDDQAVGFNDFLLAASALEDIRVSTFRDTAEGQFATYSSIAEPLLTGMQELLGRSESPTTLPERQALANLVQALDAMERRRALVSRILESTTSINEEDRIQLNILNQNIRSALAAARSLTRGGASVVIDETRIGSVAERVDQVITSAITGSDPLPSIRTWFDLVDEHTSPIESASIEISRTLEARTREIRSDEQTSLLFRWLIFGPLAALSAIMGVSAVRSNRERVDALREYHKLAAGLIEWFHPENLPEVSGVDLSVRYRPSSEQTSAGGDWYDVFVLGPSKVGLVIGDVSGHGPQAASHMAELQHLLRGQATARPLSPARQLELLDQVRSQVSIFATILYGVLDTSTGILTYSRAGHVPLCIAAADGTFRALDDGAGPPIGVGFETKRGEDSVQLMPGDVVMLVTDGLIEMRSHDIDEGLVSIEESLRGHPDDIESMADALLPPTSTGFTDDVAILLVRWRPTHRFDDGPKLDSGAGDPES